MGWPDFNPDRVIDGGLVTLRPLVAGDCDALFAAASDPEIWAGHPARDRWRREIFELYFDMLLRAGGTLAVRDAADGRMIGCSRYYASPDRPREIAIGFTFLARSHWGGAFNRAMKAAMLGPVFAVRDAAWFHIAPDNIRSQTATGRLGAKFVERKVLNLSGSDAETLCYRLDRADWIG